MSKRTNLLYVRDIMEAIDAIITYTKGIEFDAFRHDRMRYSAVIREFEIIGEAVGKLDIQIKDDFPQIAWQDIKDFRNLLIHEYFGVDLEIVWRVIQDDVQPLYQAIKDIEAEIKQASSDEGS